MGYMLQQVLGNALRQRGIERTVVTLVTQVRVSANDPAFDNPSKPIGVFLLAGPSGVGKTETALALAEAMQ
mgnify:CR=1 FL=1